MPRVKLLKYPKKPKKSAGISALENFLSRVKEIDKENARRKADAKKREGLVKKVKETRQKK